MPINYKVRIKCLTETGDEKGFHYWQETQVDNLDENIVCGDHEGSTVKDFVVESKEIV